MKKLFTFCLAFFTVSTTIFAQTNQRYYWVGRGSNNNWGTIENWSSTSGGGAAEGITNAPTNVNTVIFDQNSFPNSNTIIIDGAVQCDSLLVQNCTIKPNFNFRGSIIISGSLYLQNGTTFSSAPYINLISSRPEETIYSNSLEFSTGTILCNGGNNTIWHLAGYTKFCNLHITYGSFDLEATNFDVSGSFSYNGNADIDLNGKNIGSGYFEIVSNGNIDLGNTNINLRCQDNNCAIFSYRGNGNVNLNNANITQGDFYLYGNGIISLNEININCNIFSYTGSSNIDLHGLTIKCKDLFYLSGNGNFDLYSSNIKAVRIDIYGSGNIDLHGMVAVGTQRFMIQGYGNIDLHNANVTTENLFLQGNNINLNSIIINSHYAFVSAFTEMSLVNSNVKSLSWSYSGINISASQSVGSLIKCEVFEGGGIEKNYYNVEMINEFTNRALNATCNKITVASGDCLFSLITSDTILLLGGGNYDMNLVLVNKYLDAKPRTCGGQIILTGTSFTISDTANYIIERAIIYDLYATSEITAQKSHDWGNNTNIIFTAPDAGRDMYWTGGSSDWYDITKWKFADNSPANCVPTIADNVFFNENSTVSSRIHVFCNSMTWSGTSNGFRGTKIYIDGSLTLQNTTISSIKPPEIVLEVYFTSNQPNNTIISNGCGISGNVNFQSVSGNGGWKLIDNFSCAQISFNRGHLDMSEINVSGKDFLGKADVHTFSFNFTNGSPLRTIDFHNTNIYLTDTKPGGSTSWSYMFGQPILPAHSLNSNIIQTAAGGSNYFSSKHNDYYYNLSHKGWNDNIYCDNLSYFNKITFNTNENGTGYIYRAYTDSLIFATNSFYTIRTDLYIKKYLSTPVLEDCDEKTKLHGYNTTFLMGTDNPVLTDRVQVQDAEIEDLNITNGPYEVSNCMIKGTSTGWNSTSEQSINKNRYYWVGGGGNWSDRMHWANTSGGVPGSAGCKPPTAENTVVFDDNSFTASGQRVFVDVVAYCDSMLWIGNETLSPIMDYIGWENITRIHGSLILQKNMMYYGSSLAFYSIRPNETVQTNGVIVNSSIFFAGSSNYTLLDSLNCTMTVNYNSGTLNFNEQYVEIGFFYGHNNPNGLLNITNSEIHTNTWSYYYSNDLYVDNSIIYTTQMYVGKNAKYNNIEIVGEDNNNGYLGGGIYNRVNATISAGFYDVETDTLILSKAANNIYQFQDTIRVKKAFYGSGTPCKQIYLQSFSENIPAIFDIKTACANLDNDTLLIDYVYVHGIKALTNSDNAKLKKGYSSPDMNKSGVNWGYGIGTFHYNENWAKMLPYTAGRAPNWASDFYVPCNNFNIELNSTNMLPSYGATFEWRRNGISSEIIATTPSYFATDSATYYLTVNYGNGCTATDNVAIIITASWIDTTRIVADICQGATYTLHGFNKNEEGVFYKNLIGSYGCDSVLELTLTFTELLKDTIRTSICHGGVYNSNGFYESVAGTYNLSSRTAAGCDSLTTLILSINDILTDTIRASICQGGVYNSNGFNESVAGTYDLSSRTAAGCDSLTTLILSINDILTDTIRASICQGGVYNQNGFNENAAGTYDLSSRTATGCDILTTLILSINDIIVGAEINASICEGNAYIDEYFNETEEGKFYHITQTSAGCDSLITLNLSWYDSNDIEFYKTICEGDAYILGTQTLTQTGTFQESFPSSNGCDSIVTLHLTVAPAIKVAHNGEVYVCADAANMYVNYQASGMGVPNKYRLTVGNKEIGGGLSAWQNYEGDISSDTQIEIPMPSNVRPSHYNVEIEVFSTENCGADTVNIPFEVRYPSYVIEQKWDDVLALLNEHYNGGYIWSVYEWYKGRVQIPNASSAYYYVGGNGGKLDVGAIYQARLTRVGETEQVFTCDVEVVPFACLLECPTVLDVRQTNFKVRTCAYTNAVFYTVTGIQLGSYPLVVGETNELPIPKPAGIYLVVFSDNNGKIETRKIVVN